MVDLNGQLRLHERFQIASVRVGGEGLPVLVIDNFLSNPEILAQPGVALGAWQCSAMKPACVGMASAVWRINVLSRYS